MVNLKLQLCMQSNIMLPIYFCRKYMLLGTVIDMLSICETDCDLCELAIGRRDVFMRSFNTTTILYH